MTAAEINIYKDRISNILRRHAGVAPARTLALLPTTIKSLQGKLYEAYVLAFICQQLVVNEGCTINLMNGSDPTLRQKGGDIDRTKYPYFEILRGGKLFGELFTDIYFSTLSNDLLGTMGGARYGNCHELDIAIIEPNVQGRPGYNKIYLAVECKNIHYLGKNVVREILGFRRELSYVDSSVQTAFNAWPTALVNAFPPSVHMFYCSDVRVNRFAPNCAIFGTVMQHLRKP